MRGGEGGVRKVAERRGKVGVRPATMVRGPRRWERARTVGAGTGPRLGGGDGVGSVIRKVGAKFKKVGVRCLGKGSQGCVVELAKVGLGPTKVGVGSTRWRYLKAGRGGLRFARSWGKVGEARTAG